jgi:hypothetical protein
VLRHQRTRRRRFKVGKVSRTVPLTPTFWTCYAVMRSMMHATVSCAIIFVVVAWTFLQLDLPAHRHFPLRRHTSAHPQHTTCSRSTLAGSP